MKKAIQVVGFNAIVALIIFGAISLFLQAISHRSTPHLIHAVEIAPGSYIHGRWLDCEQSSIGGKTVCTTSINGKNIELTALPRPPRSAMSGVRPGIGNCTATINEEEIECDSAYVTSSYWPRGVKLSGANLNEQDIQQLTGGDWRNLFLGWYEATYVRLGLGLAVLGAIIMFVSTTYTAKSNHLSRLSSIGKSAIISFLTFAGGYMLALFHLLSLDLID